MNVYELLFSRATIDALSPEFIFGGLKGEIIDYVIPSLESAYLT